MKKNYIIILIILTITSCSISEFSFFKEEAEKYYQNDKFIDEEEYLKLKSYIESSDEDGFKQFKNEQNEIVDSDIIKYLLKYFKAKQINITEKDIWQPDNIYVDNKFNINIFLENSASMDGYVKGVTDFENAIYNLLGDFKISGICDSLNLNYINSEPIPFPPDVQDFITKLEPSTFEQRGGNRSVSDLKNILSTVLKTVNNKNATVLISDFVFSPGKDANAEDYLNNQSVGIKIDFAEKLKEFNLSLIVIQLESNFEGIYYREKIEGKGVSFKGKRPYFIWIFGSNDQITSILNSKILDNIKGGYLNRLVFQAIKKTNEPTFKINYSPKIGSFNAELLNKKIISEASVSKDNKNKGLFGFNLAVDFSNSLQDAKFFLDTNNYSISNSKYKLEVESILDNNNPSLKGYTHLLKLQTDVLREEVLKIEIESKIPTWVSNSTSSDDSNIINDLKEQQKTFGFKYLIEGVNDAFYPKSNSNTINTISITIKK